MSSQEADYAKLLDDLQHAEAHYRRMHDVHGDGSLQAGQAWDRMRRAGHKAREALVMKKGDEK